jgi:MFS family permease
LPTENGKPENIATTVTEVSERVTLLIREEIELAKAEVTQKVSSLVRGAAAVAAGAVFGVFGVVFGLLTLAWGLQDVLNNNHIWQGFGIVFVVLFVLAIGAFLFAWRKLKAGAPPTPVMALEEAKKIRETVGAGSEPEH